MAKILKLLVLMVIIFAGFAFKVAVYDFEKPISFTSQTILIPNGASVRRIGSILESKGILSDGDQFYWVVRFRNMIGLNDISVQSGEYEFKNGQSAREILQILTSGDVILHRITIPEGLTSMEIVDLLNQDERLTGPRIKEIPEGSMLAETYTFPRNETRQAIVKEAQKDLQILLQSIWAQKDPDHFLKSPQDVLILASIVEKETSISSERPLIAGVFLNRLKKGMLLQTDPTVIYAHEIKNKSFFTGKLYKKHLSIDSKYNTYIYSGLTPTPICHVGPDAIRAVIVPQKTDYLFFVADGTGGHVFAKTYAEHQKNHQRWRKIRRELGR